MEPITTDDGSPTFRSVKYDEPYHSKSGAIEECFEKYINPMKIWEKENPVIYDVCSGMGYNAAAAIDAFLEKGHGIMTIYLYENDPEIIRKSLEINPAFKHYFIIKELVNTYFELELIELIKEINGKTIHLILRVGDARELIPKEIERADFVFFDPFSPKKHPEMWELQFFKDIFSKTKHGGVLATYSYARIVRDNLTAAGFVVSTGPTIGRRSPSTIARKE